MFSIITYQYYLFIHNDDMIMMLRLMIVITQTYEQLVIYK